MTEICVRAVDQSEYQDGPFDFGSVDRGSLDRVINALAAIRAGIPEASRADAMCMVTGDTDDREPVASVRVCYWRPRTAEDDAASKRKKVQG